MAAQMFLCAGLVASSGLSAGFPLGASPAEYKHQLPDNPGSSGMKVLSKKKANALSPGEKEKQRSRTCMKW